MEMGNMTMIIFSVSMLFFFNATIFFIFSLIQRMLSGIRSLK